MGLPQGLRKPRKPAYTKDLTLSGPESHSLTWAEELLARLRQHHPQATIRRRDLAADPPPFVDAAFASAIVDRTSPPQAFRRSETLIQELEHADGLVIATPMHNFTVPVALKAWIDQIV